MTSLLQAAADDVRAAASYAPKEAMPMSTEEVISLLEEIRDDTSHAWTYAAIDSLTLAIAALRAQAEPGPQRDDPFAMIAALNDHIAELNRQFVDLGDAYASLQAEKIETVNAYRDATDRADRLWRLVAMLQDLLDAKEAG